MKYKVGDKVRVRKNVKNLDYCIRNAENYKGKIFTIEKVFSTGSCELKEDTRPCKWTWSETMLEPVEDIIEYKGKKYDVVGLRKADDSISPYNCAYDMEMALTEHKEEILDETEKRYLSAVIKPFRDEVEYICRNARYNGTLKKGGYSYISIKCKNDEDFCYRSGLPIFETDTMYKGMELDKEYTLDQLGL